jgi:ketosteroid isomerase-like protein
MSNQLEENKRITRELFAALERADSVAVGKLYADDFTLWSPGTLPFSGTHTKAEALRAMDMILSLFPEGLRFTITDMTAEGDRVAVEAESVGRHVSGKPYHNQYHFLLIIRDGQIRALKEYMDTQHANEVLFGSG